MKTRSIFPTCPDREFFGRSREIDYICSRAADLDRLTPNILLVGHSRLGKTEILRRVHRNLFWRHTSVVPVYYRFTAGAEPGLLAEDFLKEVIKQRIAFGRRDPEFITAELSLDRLERLLIDDGDGAGMAGFICRHREAKVVGDTTAMLRNAISVGSRGLSKIPVFLILDDFDLAAVPATPAIPATPGSGIIGEFARMLGPGGSPFLASGITLRSFEEGGLSGYVETMKLGGLAEEDAVAMMVDLSAQYGIEYDTEILTQAVRRLSGNPMYIKNIIWAAFNSSQTLLSLPDLAELYVEELTTGNIGFALRSAARLAGRDDLRVLSVCIDADDPPGSTSEEELIERFRFTPARLAEALGRLKAMALVEVKLGVVSWAGCGVMKDFIRYTCETGLKGRSVSEVKTRLVRDILKVGYSSRGEEVRGSFSEEVLSVIRSFAGQRVPKVLLKSSAFSERRAEGAGGAGGPGPGEAGTVELPRVVGCFDTLKMELKETGPPCFIADGFQNERYETGNEVVWIVSVKEELSPVNIGDVENFLRRSRLLRDRYRTARVMRWILSREGFTEEALKRLDIEGVYTSGAVQLGILAEALGPKEGLGADRSAHTVVPAKEFELLLPRSTKAEIVAARAAEEIGTEMGFDPDSIGQIKAALVEACINAFEHSRALSGKVHLRFVASADRLTIYVQNYGVDFDGAARERPTVKAGALPRKRGWGLELMRGLMDEVRFDRLAQGTRIVLVKLLKAKVEGVGGE
jgi:serine/threonine-protein kinase RsbW